ncbi:MAG: tandem-95 repeat protein [Pirellulales bacterium]|nr:tandem-95 repeat protein [Pirellulales bacterium]
MRSRLTGRAVSAALVVALLLGTHHVRADDYYLDKVWNTPDYTQTDMAYGGFPDEYGVQHGGYFCGPTAGSNSLMWLADHGYSNLASDSGDRKRDQHDLIADIAQPDYMNAYETNGVGITYFCRGFKNWIHDHGYDYERLLFQGYCQCDAEYYAGTDHPDLDWGREAISQERGVAILNIGWFTYDAATDNYEEIGGHYMTLAGYGHDGTDYNPDYLIVHDPAPRAGTTFANNYTLPVMIESGTLNGYRNAAGYYKLTDGIVIKEPAVFCILRGIIVLEMSPYNSPPVAVDDPMTEYAEQYVADEDHSINTYAYNGVLANDTDEETAQEDLIACRLTDPAHGTLTLNATGWFTYVPDDDYHGTDSFTYRVYDGESYSDAATVNLDIVSVNDVPIAVDDSYSVDENDVLHTYVYNGVLENDTDADNTDLDPANDTLAMELESDPAHGRLIWNPTGWFTYTPDTDFDGTDSFTYKVFDGTDYSNLGTVLIEVLAALDVPGDATGDGRVDEADSLRLASNWGESDADWSMGDFDDDGVVGPKDAAILAANWGYGPSEAVAVPEPSTIVIMLAWLVVLLPRRFHG